MFSCLLVNKCTFIATLLYTNNVDNVMQRKLNVIYEKDTLLKLEMSCSHMTNHRKKP